MTESTFHSPAAIALRTGLLLLLVGSPWPFGSATPRPAAFLTAGLYALFSIWLLRLAASKERLVSWPALPWVVGAVALSGLALVPLPAELLRAVAPGAFAVRAPANAAVSAVLAPDAIPLSIEPFATTTELLRMGAVAASFFLAAQLFAGRREQRALSFVVAALGVALSLFAVYQRAKWGNLLYGKYPADSGSPFGPFVNHNHFAGWVEMSALFTIGCAFSTRARSPAKSILLGGGALVMGIAVVLSQSRGGLIAFGVGLTFLGAFHLRHKGRTSLSFVLAGAAGVAVLLMLIVPKASFEQLSKRWSTARAPSNDLSLQFRLTLWSDAARVLEASPILGTGLGTFAAAIPPYRRDGDEIRAEHAESDLMELACENGLMGLGVLLGFTIAAARLVLRRLAVERGPRLGAAAAALALLVHGLFDFNTRIPANAFLLSLMLGVAVTGGHTESAPHSHSRRGVLALVALLSLFAAWTSVRIGLSRGLIRDIDLKLARPEDFASIADKLAHAGTLAPGSPDVFFKWGQLYTEEAYRSQDHARYREIRFEQARVAYRSACRLAPARGRHWFELAWTEGNLRHDDAAGPLFEHALKLEPAWSRLRANYALYLASRGRVDAALAELDQARAVHPGLDPYEAVSLLGPFVGDDATVLRRAAGSNPEGEQALARYLLERAKP